MDFKERRRTSRIRQHVSLQGGERNGTSRPHSLQLYLVPPTDTVSLAEFEELAIRRIKLLRLVETMGIKYNKSSKEYHQNLFSELKKQGFTFYIRLHVEPEEITDPVIEERRQDHISHFILRLVYCRTEELRRWFIAQESELFKFRFLRETSDRIKLFFDAYKLGYTPISVEEKIKVAHKIVNSSFSMSFHRMEEAELYKVQFTEVPDLVRARKVYLSKGWAYVPHSDLVSVVLSRFRANLSHSLSMMAKTFPKLKEDTRLLTLLSRLNTSYMGEDYSKRANSGAVHLGNIDQLSKTSFPLCMQFLHEALRTHHHLKHNGRLQYGLFLKGLGLTLEDALAFWRAEFTRVMDGDKFEKQYAYNIRHNYGKEGKRANYTPYNCSKIIMGSKPGPGDHHGCPFTHYDDNSLTQELRRLQISQNDIKSIMELKSGGHFQLACTKYFECRHPGASLGQPISHPNEYFDLSNKHLNGTGTQGPKVATIRASIYETKKPEKQQDVDMEILDESEEDLKALLDASVGF